MTQIIVALIAAAATFGGAALPIVAGIKGIKKDVSDIKEQNTEQNISILRLTVMNPEMPISERLIAGKLYVDRGGNGDVKHYYEKLLREHTK